MNKHVMTYTIQQLPRYREALKRLKANGVAYADLVGAGDRTFSAKDLENFAANLSGKARLTRKINSICDTIDTAYGGPDKILGPLDTVAMDSSGVIARILRVSKASPHPHTVDLRGVYLGVIYRNGWKLGVLRLSIINERMQYRFIHSKRRKFGPCRQESGICFWVERNRVLAFLGHDTALLIPQLMPPGADDHANFRAWELTVNEYNLGADGMALYGFQHILGRGDDNTAIQSAYFCRVADSQSSNDAGELDFDHVYDVLRRERKVFKDKTLLEGLNMLEVELGKDTVKDMLSFLEPRAMRAQASKKMHPTTGKIKIGK